MEQSGKTDDGMGVRKHEPVIISRISDYCHGGHLYFHGMIASGEMKDYSQNGEQAEILYYLDKVGLKAGHLVDLGAGDGYTMSNTRALLEMGWTGTLLDGDPRGAKDVVKQWITKECVKAILDCRCKFLNIDLDGNDYWILDAMLNGTACVPDLIVCEINPIFQRDEAKVMPYNGSHVWDGTTYYGMSLAAAEKLLAKYHYTLAYLHAGINAFFLFHGAAKEHPELIRPIEYKPKVDHRPDPKNRPWITLS